MRIVAIAGSQIPSDTANSLQVMKACQALVQLGHDLTLIVPDFDLRPSILRQAQDNAFNLQQQYGLQTDFHIEWLASLNRRLFTWRARQSD